MQWICEESGATYSYPLEEVVGKVHCIGCGKTHHLKRGELNNQDKRQLEKIAEEAKENKALIDIIGVISETDYIHWHIRGDDFSSG